MTETMTVEELRAAEAAEGSEGQTIEDMAEGGVEPDEDREVYIEGTTGQLSLSVGGRKPDSSSFKMKSAEVKVRNGQYTKGETVILKVIARIDEVKFTDQHDEYGTVTATKRTHFARPLSVERVDEEGEVA